MIVTCAPSIFRSSTGGRTRRRSLGEGQHALAPRGDGEETTRCARRLDELVATYTDPDEARRQYLQNEAATRQLQMSVLEDQAVAWVVEAAEVKDQPATFKDIMNFGADPASEAVG